jgi:hypothetical protein
MSLPRRAFDQRLGPVGLGMERWGPATVDKVIAERLRVVSTSAAAGRPTLRREPHDPRSGPLFFSFGRVELLCGECAFTLIAGAPRPDVIRDAVVICPRCDSANESWDALATRPSSAHPGAPGRRRPHH